MANDPNRSGPGPEISEAKQRIERETEAARQSAQRVGETVQRQAEDITSDIQAQAQEMLSGQKEIAKSGLMDVVSAIRRAADDLDQRQQSQFASMARSVAGGLEDFAQAIGRRNLQDMASDVQKFARDHPTAFFGGAVLVGLALARFAKSSSQHDRSHHMRTEQTRAEQAGMRYGAQPAEQGGQLGQFARQEREQGRGVETSIRR